jgi:iron complex transport system substrate-binding protein
MIRKQILSYLLLLLSAGLGNIHILAANRTVKDMAGRKVQVPVAVNAVFSDRFTSLLIFAVDPKILVNSTFSVKEGLRKYISPDYYTKPVAEDQDEEILKMRPDIIIVGNLRNKMTIDDANKMQKRLKIPVVVVDFTLDRCSESFRFLGNLLKKQEMAESINNYLQKYILPIAAKARSIRDSSKPKIYYAEGPNGLNTEPSGSIHSQVINFVCGRNVAITELGDVHGMTKVSMEQVLRWNPDIILVWTGYPYGMGLPNNSNADKQTYGYITQNAIWRKIKAVKEEKVYQIPAVPFGWFDRPPSSNCIPGVIWLSRILYPHLITYDINEAIREYFELFYHIRISAGEARKLLG